MRSSSTLKISPGDWPATDARGVCFVGRFRGGIDEYATITQWRQAIFRAFSACAPKVPPGAHYRQRPPFPRVRSTPPAWHLCLAKGEDALRDDVPLDILGDRMIRLAQHDQFFAL